MQPKDAPSSLPVRVMDPNGGVIDLEPNGDSTPPPRGSHTAALLGSRIYVFGGEDPLRKPLNDLWFLDLESVTWSQPQPEGTPPPSKICPHLRCIPQSIPARFRRGQHHKVLPRLICAGHPLNPHALVQTSAEAGLREGIQGRRLNRPPSRAQWNHCRLDLVHRRRWQ